MLVFQGKSVLVLGGSRGIGAAIVRRFADEGAKVTFTYGASHGGRAGESDGQHFHTGGQC
ncbi:SDR family NAD(P)-dependent oxidoreductase [Agrobacterium tumefaciens]|uniref:SDR family NAD(P)-dependent oxidoreductase n=1 Tax=Agrobacterium tumefaciens TaxID=358 RepID=UPI003969D927